MSLWSVAAPGASGNFSRRGHAPTLPNVRSLRRGRSEAVILETRLGDITEERVDAIVNAANQHLAGGGGVDGAIHRAAGARELRAACAALGGCATGDAKATEAFRLAARWIIHAVGPRYRGGGHGEAALLESCYRRSLEVADELGARSVAFPAISTGIYGYPLDEATDIAVETVSGAATEVQLVRFVCFDARTFGAYELRVRDPRS